MLITTNNLEEHFVILWALIHSDLTFDRPGKK